MARQRSQRKLINDRLDRNINCHNESIRRLEEVMAFYLEGESERPGNYTQIMAMLAEIMEAENSMLKVYDVFRELGKP